MSIASDLRKAALILHDEGCQDAGICYALFKVSKRDRAETNPFGRYMRAKCFVDEYLPSGPSTFAYPSGECKEARILAALWMALDAEEEAL